MDKISYGNISYDVLESINFSGSKHLIITDNESVFFVNKRENKIYPAMTKLSIMDNLDIPLSYIRKQHLLWYLVNFINERKIMELSAIRKLVNTFKSYIKTSNVEKFLYWPLLNEDEFNIELKDILKDLEELLINSIQAKDPDFMDVKIVKVV